MEWVKLGIDLKTALAKSQKGGELKSPLAQKITEMVGFGTGISAKLNEKGELITLDGKILKPNDARKLGQAMQKFMEVYARHRKKSGITDIEAAAITYKEVFPEKSPPPNGEEKKIKDDKPQRLPGSSVPSFKYNARKKSQD